MFHCMKIILLFLLSLSCKLNIHEQIACAFQNNQLIIKHRNILSHKKLSINAVVTTIQDASMKSKSNPIEEEEEEEFSFPPPLTPIQGLGRAATFWSTAVPIALSYYGTYAEIKIRKQLLGTGSYSENEVQKIWDEQHEDGAHKLANVFASLNGFYVKTAQIIASRGDLFPKQYTEALSGFTDDLDPMPSHLAKAIIKKELLNPNESFDDVFVEFDDIPLGSASVAQVHRAVLSEKYGGPKEVAVKVQRPSIESKLLGDIANLKSLAKSLKKSLPLDYYTVFCELEKQLKDEFDFVAEASAMDRIYNSLSRSMDGTYPVNVPVVIPRPIPGLVSRRVLVMDYLDGVPLSRVRDVMIKKGIDPDNSPEAKIFGKKLLKGLTYVFGRSILETGFFHADPHPGNIFVLEDGRIGLIDFGQVKQISGRNKETLAKVMIALNKLDIHNTNDLRSIGELALELGVTLKDDAPDDAAPAIAYWLFDGSVETLPGGYDKGELSPNSPVKQLQSFPQDLVLVGRSTILIKGLSNRLNIPWSLAKEWAPIAEQVLQSTTTKQQKSKNRVRFKQVWYTFKSWGKGRINSLGTKLPTPIRRLVASFAVYLDGRNSQTK